MSRWMVALLGIGLVIWSLGHVSGSATIPRTPTTQTFLDVPPSHPFYAHIEQLAAWGSITGFPCGGPGEPCDGTGRRYFRPAAPLLRQDLATMVSHTKRYPDTPTGQHYVDVPPTHAFYRVIEHLWMYGLVAGTSCGGSLPCDGSGRTYFLPDTVATRGVVAKVVAIAAGFHETPTTHTFIDVPPHHPLYPFIERLAVRGIAAGFPCGAASMPCDGTGRRYFLPDANADRGAGAKWVSYLIPPATPTPTPLPPTVIPSATPLPPTAIPTPTTVSATPTHGHGAQRHIYVPVVIKLGAPRANTPSER